jgi:hypothetical protein
MSTQKITVKAGALLLPWNIMVELNGNPVNLATYDTTFRLETDDGTVVQASAVTTKHPTQDFTLDATNNWIYCVTHGFEPGQIWVPSTSGSLSGTGLTASTRYVILEKDVDWFRVSLRTGGAAVTIAAAGTPTHSGYVVGSVQYQPVTADVTTARNLRGWVNIATGANPFTFPADGHIPIEIQAVGN